MGAMGKALAGYRQICGFERIRERCAAGDLAYRDWVINALIAICRLINSSSSNLPGQLPDPTPQQRIATGFHRNTMIMRRGESTSRNFATRQFVDRVQTTATGCWG